MTTTSEPAKIILEYRVKAGAADAFERWVQRLMQHASASPALQGSSVLTTVSGEYVILLRFASQGELEGWHASPEVVALLREGDALAITHAPTQRTGLETWFTLPGVPAPGVPPRWKMALVTWLALLPQVIVLGRIIPGTWPFPIGVVVATAIPVAMLTWVIMPRLTAWLYGWLYHRSLPAEPHMKPLTRPS